MPRSLLTGKNAVLRVNGKKVAYASATTNHLEAPVVAFMLFLGMTGHNSAVDLLGGNDMFLLRKGWMKQFQGDYNSFRTLITGDFKINGK